jgi:hypothetical protein
MPTLITETVDGEVLTMIEPYYLVTLENKGVMWFLRGTAWTQLKIAPPNIRPSTQRSRRQWWPESS